MQRKPGGEIFCKFASMTSLTLNSKLCSFKTWWNLIKTPQNFVRRSLSIKSTKTCHKNKGQVLVSGLLYGNFNKLFFTRYIDCEWRLFILCKLSPTNKTVPFSFSMRKRSCFCTQKWKDSWSDLIVRHRIWYITERKIRIGRIG